MRKYENLLEDLLFGAKDLIAKANNVSDQFDMSIRLAEQVTKAIKVTNQQGHLTIQQKPVEEPVVEIVKQVHSAISKEEYEDVLGYKISQAAYDEYVDMFNRQAAGEEFNVWIPDEEGLCPVPEGAIVPLAIQENPVYKKLEEKQEEVVEEEEVAEEEPEAVEEIPMPTDVTAEVAGAEVAEQAIEDMPIEELVEQVLAEEDNGVEIDIEEDPEPEQVVAEIDGENMDITEQYKLMKELNKDLSYDEAVERAVDWVEFGINKETYDILNFIEDDSAEVIQCKTYLAYYIDAMTMEYIVYYINYFASNIEEDEEGNEVYVNDELQLEFLNKDNISAFLEYVQQNQQ